jgi:hypothetical protein
MLWYLLLVYFKQVDSARFDHYLGYNQANSIKHEPRYVNFCCSNIDP